MFGLFSVQVKQTGEYVHITGVSYYDLARDIEKFYSSSLLTKHQIKKESWDTIKVRNFFLVELRNILVELLKVRNLRSRRRALNDLMHLLDTETWIKDTVNPSGKPFDFKKLERFNTKPFPKQHEFLEQYPIVTNSYHLRGLLLDAVPGSGKAMPLHTLVKVPNGWKRLGDLKQGEPVVTPDGKIAKVVGIYPQGKTPVYRFHFEDGRTADSHPEHLWNVNEISQVGDEQQISVGNVTTTQDIVNHFDQFGYTIPLVGKISGYSFNKKGTARQTARFYLGRNAVIEPEVLELPYEERFEIVKEMISEAALHLNSERYEFLHDNKIGVENFRQLMWSIGGIAHEPVETEGMRLVEFKHRDVDKLLEGLVGDLPETRKRFNTKQHKDLALKIVGFEKRPEEETLCISIDSEQKLYVVDNYVVTHNTFTSLAWSQLVNDDPTVVLCPLNIVDEVWVKQINHHFKKTPTYWTSKQNVPLTPDKDFYIVHYDYITSGNAMYLQKFLQELSKKHGGRLKLIIDECHNFNDIKASRTRKVVEWADLNIFGHFLPISGTPLKALGSEIYPILCMIDLFFDRIAREAFMASYGRNRPALIELLSHRIGRSKFSIPDLTGMEAPPPFELIKVQIPKSDMYTLDAIRLEMQSYISDRIKFYNHAMPEMLEFYNDCVYSYELSIQTDPRAMEQLALYKAIVHRFRTSGYNSFTDVQDGMFCKKVEEEMEARMRGGELKEFRNIKSAVKYLPLKLRGEALGNVLGRARINAIKDTIAYAGLPEMIDNVEKKTVIFTSYIDALKITEEYLTKQGYGVVTVYGENSKERDDAIRRFEKDPKLHVLVAVYDSLKEGYPLLMANQIICLNAPFRDHELKQVQARIWRTGQDTMCFFKMLDLDTGEKLNITTRSINIMEWSREQVDALLSRQQVNLVLDNVSGQEMFEMSDEPVCLPMQVRNNALSLFL